MCSIKGNSTHLGLIGLLRELSIALLDEDVSYVDSILDLRVLVHIHMQDAVHHREDLHKRGAAAHQRGKSLAGPVTLVLTTNKRLCRWPHFANLKFQSLQDRRAQLK
ncbi:hypothetical protein P7K49_003368 [Saguinus oedipus]|uniref:Uncharacterized protein n=1 Tax=Saguinus oedipus TaxID=9490 RepID=A0ABQ9W7Y0_SAGOE|nr:hypothetical protein P7K49_003368 [Saguinus oedipus]